MNMPRLYVTLLLLAAVSLLSYGEERDSAAIRSLQALEARAAAGDNDARFRLARTLETGYGNLLPRDSVRARRLFETAAEAGFAPAQNYLGFLLYTQQQPDSAVTWMMRAADNGDITAYSNLGWMLLHGEGVRRDYDKALYWLEKGTAAGSAPAAAMLGDMYCTGTGILPDTAAAIRCYDKALTLYSAAPYRDPQAVADITAALTGIYSAADTLCADSIREREAFYYRHNAAPAGAIFLRRLAERGDTGAQARLGKAYALGDGVPYSHSKSLLWYMKAAQGGNPAAQYIIGELLQLLPDALDELPDELRSSLTDEMLSAQYWLDRAAEAGVTSGRQADMLLGRH